MSLPKAGASAHLHDEGLRPWVPLLSTCTLTLGPLHPPSRLHHAGQASLDLSAERQEGFLRIPPTP